MEHTGTIITETRFISAKDVDMTSSEQQALPIPDTPLALSTPINPCGPSITDSSTTPMIKSFSTFRGSLSLPVDHPLSMEEETLSRHLVGSKLHTDLHKRQYNARPEDNPQGYKTVLHQEKPQI